MRLTSAQTERLRAAHLRDTPLAADDMLFVAFYKAVWSRGREAAAKPKDRK